MRRTDPLERFGRQVDCTSSECWLWTGALNWRGYGQFHWEGRRGGAHIFSYLTFVGDIGAGYEIDHVCRVRNCVRPDHLEAVTHRENLMRGTSFAAVNAAKTHCDHGHEFTPANTYRRPTGLANRECRTCRSARRLAHARRKSAARQAVAA